MIRRLPDDRKERTEAIGQFLAAHTHSFCYLWSHPGLSGARFEYIVTHAYASVAGLPMSELAGVV